MDRKEIAAVLASAGLRPQHHLGQNFMVDPATLRAIADAGEIGPRDIILEVGPGVGNLTRELARRVPEGHVLAVDIDEKLLPAAQRHHEDLKNVTWLLADVLAGKHEVEPRVLEKLRELRAAAKGGGGEAGGLKLVSNLPYNAASPLIAELLVTMWQEIRNGIETPLVFSRLAFTVQFEVGRRMAAAPDTRDYGPLGIIIQLLADASVVRKIPPGAFWPPPKINSALVSVTPRLERFGALRDAPVFQRFLAGIFSHRRQNLGNALKHYYGESWSPEWKRRLSAAGFDLLLRPENLAAGELLRLENVIHQELLAAVPARARVAAAAPSVRDDKGI